MSTANRSAKEVYNKLQNRSEQASLKELRSLVEEHFPAEALAEKAHEHYANNLEVAVMETTEDWFQTALTIDYDGPEIHEMIEDYTEEVYELTEE